MKYFMLSLLLIFPLIANAEIFRQATYDESGQICFYWWPKLKEVNGWFQDIPSSFHYRANTQAPKGFTFSNAEAVIYAKAVYKPEEPEAKNLDQFIENDKASFKSNDPGLKLIEAGEIKDSKGRTYKAIEFKPSPGGNWEQVTYSEEIDGDKNEYYLVFVLSAKTEVAYKSALKAFREFIISYE
jgi:hypothetical protein